MEPSFIWVTAFSGLVRLLSSDSTSTIRSADSMDIVIITNTMDSIIRLMRIWKLYVKIADIWPTATSVPWLVMTM